MQLKPKINYRRFKKYYHDKIMIDMEKLFIDNEDIKLEAEYYVSSTVQTSAVLVCHPHPQIN